MTITGIIHTLNEERQIARAIRSLTPWVDEVLVVDMHSDDRTVPIARSLGARVELFERMGFADPARAFGLEQATGDWVISIDADELVPPTLASRLRRIAEDDEADLVRVPRRNYLLGAELHATGWQMEFERELKFFRRSAMRYTGDIHDFARPLDGKRELVLDPVADLAIVHFNYRDLSEFLSKMDRYTTVEAQQRADEPDSWKLRSHVRTIGMEFAYRLLRTRGYRDGWRGFTLSWLMATYRLLVWAKLRELHETGGRSAIEESYAEEAERVLAGYR